MLAPSLFNDSFDLFDRFYEDPWFGFDGSEMKNPEKKLYGHRPKNIMTTDIKETDNGYEMTVDLPGFKKEDVTVELENGYLTISAAKGYENDTKDDSKEKCRYIKHERYCGSCQRSFYVGNALTVDDIKANFQHGILKLDIPKPEKEEHPKNKCVPIEG